MCGSFLCAVYKFSFILSFIHPPIHDLTKKCFLCFKVECLELRPGDTRNSVGIDELWTQQFVTISDMMILLLSAVVVVVDWLKGRLRMVSIFLYGCCCFLNTDKCVVFLKWCGHSSYTIW